MKQRLGAFATFLLAFVIGAFVYVIGMAAIRWVVLYAFSYALEPWVAAAVVSGVIWLALFVGSEEDADETPETFEAYD